MKEMDLNEFREAGYLREVNRLFFHPLGLALSVSVNDDTGKVTNLASIWDIRDTDPEGFIFGGFSEEEVAQGKAILSAPQLYTRAERLGFTIEPLVARDEPEEEKADS